MSEKEYLDLNYFFGKLTREHRRIHKNYSLEKLGQEIKVDPNHLSRIERGKHLPGIITFLKIAHELEIHQNDFLPQAIEIINRYEKNIM
ncbi:helix-turn-helix domain-containing protein [Pseudogracilibacillus sp. SO30301A]|uniref:helix-turn-helix domain-containing protein n=1 Tax=Pseudogracilibacillus sp. SO30301A TaxID=3098291 RepID=UPI00300E5AC8